MKENVSGCFFSEHSVEARHNAKDRSLGLSRALLGKHQ